VAAITDSLGNKILYSYDSDGRRTGEAVHDPLNVLIRYAGYGYDDNGRMNTVTLPGNAQETSNTGTPYVLVCINRYGVPVFPSYFPYRKSL
jgi:YD repeat-containing protein